MEFFVARWRFLVVRPSASLVGFGGSLALLQDQLVPDLPSLPLGGLLRETEGSQTQNGNDGDSNATVQLQVCTSTVMTSGRYFY